MQEIPGDPRQCTVATQAVEHPEMSSRFWTIRVSCPCWEGWVSQSGRSAQHTSWGPTNVTVAVQTCQPGPGLWLLLESGHSSRSFVLQWSPQVTNKETRREGSISERHGTQCSNTHLPQKIQGSLGLLCSFWMKYPGRDHGKIGLQGGEGCPHRVYREWAQTAESVGGCGNLTVSLEWNVAEL